MDLVLPNYNRAIFSIVPTILSCNLKVDLEEPYSRYTLKDGSLLKHFEESDINIVVIIDSLCEGGLHGFIRDKWLENGQLELSSVVPSTTGNAVGSIYIGLPPEISGLIAMRFYVPEIGNFVNVLYGKASEDALFPLYTAGVKLSHLLWEKPILDAYADKDLSFVDLLPNFIRGGLENFYNDNMVTLHFETDNDSVYELRDVVKRFIEKNLRGIIFLYYHHLDSISHKYGYKSSEWHSELENVNRLIKKMTIFMSELSERHGKKINVYVVSDHGHVHIDKIIKIDNSEWEKHLNELGIKAFQQSDRFGFFYTDKGSVEEAINNLKGRLGDNAYIFSIEEAIDLGFWPEVKRYNLEKFLQRAGQIVSITKGNTSIRIVGEEDESNIFYDLGHEYRELRGRHGGMTEEEMITPFVPFHFG